MKPPQNRRVFVIGYAAATALGKDFATTWRRAVQGEAGFRRLTRCTVDSRSNIVGEIPQWSPGEYEFVDKKDAGNWNAGFVFLTMALCQQALTHAGDTNLSTPHLDAFAAGGKFFCQLLDAKPQP